MTLRLEVKTPCWACERREGDVPVMVGGELVYICDPCWERVEDPPEEPEPLTHEGDPAWNGAFDRW